jgi:ribose transport system permease protein
MLQRLLPFLSLLGLFIGLSIASPYFLTSTNLSSVARQTAVINIMALGMTLVIVAGGIDLSVGAMMAFAGLMGTRMIETGSPIPVGILAGLLAGGFWGFVNGFLTMRLRIAPFIVTLGTLGIIRGLTLIYSGGLPVAGLPREFGFLGEGTILGLPVVLYLVVISGFITHAILDYTRLGRYAYAIGSNREAALYAGVPVAFHTVAVYAISGMFVGLAGMIEASRLMTGQPTAGQGYELQVIAAVVIGGGSLSGGEGSVTGTLIGAFIMGLLANGCDLLGISPYIQQAVIGAIIILAVTLDGVRKRKFAKA